MNSTFIGIWGLSNRLNSFRQKIVLGHSLQLSDLNDTSTQATHTLSMYIKSHLTPMVYLPCRKRFQLNIYERQVLKMQSPVEETAFYRWKASPQNIKSKLSAKRFKDKNKNIQICLPIVGINGNLQIVEGELPRIFSSSILLTNCMLQMQED